MTLSKDQLDKLMGSMPIRPCENCGKNGQLELLPNVLGLQVSGPDKKSTGKGQRVLTVFCRTCVSMRFFHAGFCMEKAGVKET